MASSLSKKHLIFLTLVFTSFFAVISQALAATWTGPTATPPANNKEEPINVGTTPQSKDGYLLLRNSGASNNLSLQEIGSGNILNFRVNNGGSGTSSTWILPKDPGLTGQALVVSSVSGGAMNLSWSSSSMPPGPAIGATWYWDGTSWIPNNMIHNNGATGVGIHLQGGAAPITALQVDGIIAPQFNASSDIGTAALKWRDIYANTFIGTLNPGFTSGSVYYQSVAGMTQDNANFFWDAGNQSLGLGTNNPNSRLHIYKTSGTNAEIDLQSNAGAQNHWAIYNDRTSDELRFWKNAANRFSFAADGTMTLGTVPWARLASVTSCGGATPVVIGFNSSGPICGPGSSLADPGATGSTLYWNGTAWVGSTNIYNNNGNVGVGVASPADFKLQVAGSVGPNVDGASDLGSAAKRWNNIYANNITASLNPSLTNGSVYFQGASGLTQDNANFFWDVTNHRLGLGTNAPANFVLDANGSVGPHADNTFSLGSATNRWANLYATNIISTPGGINLGIPNAALVFGSSSGTLDYDAGFLYNKSVSRLTVGNNSNTTGTSAILAKGNVYPNADNTFDLGSASLQWRNIFTKNLSIGGFTQGSLIFQGASGLAENNPNLFWDNTDNRLGIGTGHPLDIFQVNSDWYELPGGSCLMQISSASSNVSGVDGSENCWFTHDLAIGTEIQNKVTGEYRMITAISDNHNLTVDRPWSNSATVAFRYRIKNLGLGESGKLNFGGGLTDTYTNTPIGGGSAIYLSGKLFMHNSGWSDNYDGPSMVSPNNFYFSNTFIGESAGANFAQNDEVPYTQLNTAVGYFALADTETDAFSSLGANTALGAFALNHNSSGGQDNVAIGARSLLNGGGSNNVSVGFEALGSNASGTGSNTVLGYRAGKNNAGNKNVYLGASTGENNTNGDRNVFVGFESGKSAIGSSISNTLLVNNADSDQYNSLLYGHFASAGAPFLRVNGELQFGFGANAYRRGLSNNGGNGLCINMGANQLQLFLINGAIICTRVIPGANCNGQDFAACCALQAQGCQ